MKNYDYAKVVGSIVIGNEEGAKEFIVKTCTDSNMSRLEKKRIKYVRPENTNLHKRESK